MRETSMLKVLVVGCGNIAGGFDAAASPTDPPRTHARAYQAHGQFSLEACVEPNTARRQAFMARWGVHRGYASLHEVLDAQEYFDVISVCSPTDAHYDDTRLALALGPRLVFCEKPVCDDLALAEDLVARCRDHGTLLAVNHNRRWDPDLRRLREELAAGVWGALRSVSCLYNKGVLNNGSHLMDLLHDLLGPLSLLHTGEPVVDYSATDPSIPATLVTATGVPVSLSCGHAADYSLFEVQLVTQRGVIAMEDGGTRWRVRMAGASSQFQGYQALVDGDILPGHYLQSMANAVSNIYDAVVNGGALASNGDTALAAQRMCRLISKL